MLHFIVVEGCCYCGTTVYCGPGYCGPGYCGLGYYDAAVYGHPGYDHSI